MALVTCLYKTFPRNFCHKAQAENPGPDERKCSFRFLVAWSYKLGSDVLPAKVGETEKPAVTGQCLSWAWHIPSWGSQMELNLLVSGLDWGNKSSCLCGPVVLKRWLSWAGKIPFAFWRKACGKISRFIIFRGALGLFNLEERGTWGDMICGLQEAGGLPCGKRTGVIFSCSGGWTWASA